MKRKEIFKKCIEKAVENGWDSCGYLKKPIEINLIGKQISIHGNCEWINETINDILFDHSFAKAFWGEKMKDCKGCEWICPMNEKINSCLPEWKCRIIGLALVKDRLKYMEQFL